MFQDEARFGTLTSFSRAWYLRGKDFVVTNKQGRANFYTYAAVAPETGEIFSQNLNVANLENMSNFLLNISAKYSEKSILMIMDRAPWHTSKKLNIPQNIQLMFLPPCSPQLNPAEHLWKHMRSEYIHNVVFDKIEDISDCVTHALQCLTAEKIKTLCACNYL